MNKNLIKLGIYLCALLMMGAIAVASNIANIIAAFPEIPPTTIVAYIISVPSLVVIPVTLITGKLMDTMAKKNLMIAGILFWLIGGVLPYFLGSIFAIVVARAIFGVGIGMVQTLCAALVMENFEDHEERNKTMGNMTAFQMLGTIIFSLVAGNLGQMGWNVAFLVHAVSLVSLFAAFFFLPYKKPEPVESGKSAFSPSPMMWIWVIAFCLFMFGGQTYANTASSIITEMNLGDSAAAGNSLAIFAFGGLVMGFSFGKFAKVFGKMTLSAGCALLIIAYLFLAFGPSLLLAYVGAFITGIAISVCMPCIFNGAANSVDQASSGMAVSVATCLQNVGMALSPYVVFPIGAAIASDGASLTVNQGALIAAMGIVAVVGVAFAVISNKKSA